MDPSGPKPVSDGDWAQPVKHRGGKEHSQLGLGYPCADLAPGQSPERRKCREDVFTGVPPALLTPSTGVPRISQPVQGKQKRGNGISSAARHEEYQHSCWVLGSLCSAAAAAHTHATHVRARTLLTSTCRQQLWFGQGLPES